jgi:parafibromin
MQKKPQHTTAASIINNPSLALNPKAPTRRPDPIILLSPSASSILRMSNIRSFLESGRYVPPDNSATTTQMLHVQRVMKDIDPSRPMRFILVESPEQFKQEYWNRLVAVFTTGQTWQFKSYKWREPEHLFSHVLGVFVGWRGEPPPENIRSWGHKVASYGIDRWRDAPGGGAGAVATEAVRFRDKEVVESIWKAIESGMRAKGWKRDAAPREI